MKVKKFILVLVFLSSCVPLGGNTITPSTGTFTPAETLTPSPSATATLVLPEDDASAYKFKPLSEDEYQYIFDVLNFKVDDPRFIIDYYRKPPSLVALQSEYLLNFPDSKYKREAEWGIVINNPDAFTPKSQPDKDLMEIYLLEMFSNGLSIEEIQKELESQNIWIMNSFETKNLIGNNENGFVLLIRIPDSNYSEATFVIYLDNGVYHVEKIKDWDITSYVASGFYYDIFDIGDTNKNGLSEIIVREEHGFSGMPIVHRQWIHHVEWSNESKEFISQKIPIFSHGCDDINGGTCESKWEFSMINSRYAFTISAYLYTREACPIMRFQRTFFWNGEKYAVDEVEIASPDKSLPLECLLAWVETASAVKTLDNTLNDDGVISWKNNEVIFYMEESLKNWSPAMDKMFGPASQDYVKLQLGIWYDQRGEYEKAIFVLQELANNPYSKEYDFISQMGNLYIQTRDEFGITQACIKVENAFSQNFRELIIEPSFYNKDKDTLQIWGVIDWKGNLCDRKEMFKSEIESMNFLDSESLITWLNNANFDVYQDISKDFDNNGITDLLVLIDKDELWFFYLTPNGYKAQYLDSYIWDDVTKVKMLDLSDFTNQQIFLLTANDWVRVIRFLPNGEIEVLVDEYYGIKSLNVASTSNIVRIIMNFESSWEASEKRIYEWNALEEKFFLTPNVFEVVKKEFEGSLFVNYKYLEAITEIEEFLSNAPPEPIEWSSCGIDIGCTYSPPFYIPYFRYLQGLSYEQLGNFDKARDVYYELWRDYPDNVFGVVASMKLELVK